MARSSPTRSTFPRRSSRRRRARKRRKQPAKRRIPARPEGREEERRVGGEAGGRLVATGRHIGCGFAGRAVSGVRGRPVEEPFAEAMICRPGHDQRRKGHRPGRRDDGFEVRSAVQAARLGDAGPGTAYLSLAIVGADGEMVNNLLVNGSRPGRPSITITDPNGKVVATGNFEYGSGFTCRYPWRVPSKLARRVPRAREDGGRTVCRRGFGTDGAQEVGPIRLSACRGRSAARVITDRRLGQGCPPFGKRDECQQEHRLAYFSDKRNTHIEVLHLGAQCVCPTAWPDHPEQAQP